MTRLVREQSLPFSLTRLLRLVFGGLVFGGTRWLRSYERVIFERCGAFLGEEAADELMAQLPYLQTCQRSSGDRIVLISYLPECAMIPGMDDVEILRGSISTTNPRRSASFRVWAYKGRPKQITFSRKPDDFFDSMDVSVRFTPKPWRSKKDFTEVVDALEHPELQAD